MAPVLRRALILALSVATGTGVFLADIATGSEISLSFLYLVPVALATWFLGRRAGLLLAGLSAAGWVAAYLETGHLYSAPHILYWNATVELATFCAVALALSRVRSGLDRERALARRLEQAYRLLDREQQQVGSLQRRLLPAEPPEIPGYAIAVHYATSARAGGDYYDFFPLPRGRLGILVADASGHGTPAAVVMAIMRALLHTAPDTLDSPEHALAALNTRLIGNLPPGSFATACYAALDPATGSIEYALGGHHPALLVRGADGSVESLTSPDGLPLGVWPAATFSSQSARLACGDTLLVFTDGLIEARSPEGALFGEDPVRRLLAAHRQAEPEDIQQRLLEALSAHAGRRPLEDDLTLVLIRSLRP
ncbi:MAG TPA: PP2C family protein-serine/threonine phosphatase [Candidatus Eisenbacteria bacterium]